MGWILGTNRRRSKYTSENACTTTDATAVRWVGYVGGGG